MNILKVNEFSEEVFQSVSRLVPQLGSHTSLPSRDELSALIDSKCSTLLVARFPGENSGIVGILTISIYRVPTGIRSIVEDVIVDKTMRRRGVARALVSSAIELARDAGAKGVALTSNVNKVEANLLYQKMGFEKRNTNAYFYKL